MNIKLNLALQVTLLRIFLTPCIVWSMAQQWFFLAIILFMGAMMTDFLDGFIARRYHQESRIGQLLDPVADKLLILAVAYVQVMLGMENSEFFLKMPLFSFSVFMMAKEILFLLVASFLYLRYSFFFKPTFFSRSVSISEMVLLWLLLLYQAMYYQVPFFLKLLLVKGITFFMYAIIIGSVVLILQYSIKIVDFLRKRS
ncbi:CDP-alcohol phosphatidyltransferase family protein [Candidatus Dependentiae bacterium]|nr:CDP-alcohol phosphatidyltransferase family protein [Candidatus Dependentiae bacterium]